MKIDRTDEAVKALERTIIDLNDFLDGFDIGGGTHHGYIREFNCGDHRSFAWNLGGRLYSAGSASYQQMKPTERLKMVIDDKPVCELDIRPSALSIFQALGGQPLDFTNNADPYAVDELTPRELVKAFITATFGKGQLPARWPQNVSRGYEEAIGHRLSEDYPITQVRDAVATAYPLLAELKPSDVQPTNLGQADVLGERGRAAYNAGPRGPRYSQPLCPGQHHCSARQRAQGKRYPF